MRLKSWKVLPLLLVILSVLCVVAPAQGALYKGDWCSFEAPYGYTVFSEDDDSVILQKVVSSNPPLLMQLAVFRDEDMSSSDSTLKLTLEMLIDTFAEGLQEDGLIGDCTGNATDIATHMMDGLHGRTAYNVRIHDYPYAKILGYAWGENNDVVYMSLLWSGSQVPYKDADYVVKPIGDAYRTFKYYG